ncbi:acyl-CoA dehydrogenase family protein [Cupriavidus numazuensis]|uniref:Acyl-CoA dehydrogenase n=1 Tax=Cupriavidus numazuensis TaxID=221992 RepID=A0ABM8TPJ5_9BURK|nr:acyl-CoA dehydrogenase [Cupriavidus numazuensis]CAG2157329.1 hypothetical protein LMG26411_05538 [Cupriavidus numazuensis]
MNLRDTIRGLIDSQRPSGDIPLPGHGHTAARWQVFATIAATQGPVAIKLFEAHADALAILAEVAGACPGRDTHWAIWAAEPPDARVRARPAPDVDAQTLATRADIAHGKPLLLNGRKAWCSGAGGVSHALLTCHGDDDVAVLAAIDMGGPGVTITTDGWHAVGMADTASGDVLLHDCPALQVGGPRAYLERPGFWHGGAGIAACWYGSVLPLAWAVRDTMRKHGDAHAAAHLGAIDGDLHAAAALLRETAAWIDANPTEDAFVAAMRLRTAVEAAVQRVLHRAGNVLGAGPLCRNARLASLYADLPVFLRQSHAERDLAVLGTAVSHTDCDYAL